MWWHTTAVFHQNQNNIYSRDTDEANDVSWRLLDLLPSEVFFLWHKISFSCSCCEWICKWNCKSGPEDQMQPRHSPEWPRLWCLESVTLVRRDLGTTGSSLCGLWWWCHRFNFAWNDKYMLCLVPENLKCVRSISVSRSSFVVSSCMLATDNVQHNWDTTHFY